jgi:hypothetical protein
MKAKTRTGALLLSLLVIFTVVLGACGPDANNPYAVAQTVTTPDNEIVVLNLKSV